MSPRARFAASLRTLEALYRSDGHYESAVQTQMTADCIESEPERLAPMCSWFQRGFDRVPEMFTKDGMLGILLVNGMIHYLTDDAAEALLGGLVNHLKITSSELRALARHIDEVDHVSDYDEEPFTKDPP